MCSTMKTEIMFASYTSYIHVHIYTAYTQYTYMCIYVYVCLVVWCSLCVNACMCVCAHVCAFKAGEIITRALNTRENSFMEKEHFQVKD